MTEDFMIANLTLTGKNLDISQQKNARVNRPGYEIKAIDERKR